MRDSLLQPPRLEQLLCRDHTEIVGDAVQHESVGLGGEHTNLRTISFDSIYLRTSK